MTSPFSTLEHTIKADLQAGVSWLEHEAAEVGLGLWNILKGVFIALEHAEAAILVDVLTVAVQSAQSGHTIEEIHTAALNTAKREQQDILLKAGTGVVQTIIAGIKASL